MYMRGVTWLLTLSADQQQLSSNKDCSVEGKGRSKLGIKMGKMPQKLKCKNNVLSFHRGLGAGAVSWPGAVTFWTNKNIFYIFVSHKQVVTCLLVSFRGADRQIWFIFGVSMLS